MGVTDDVFNTLVDLQKMVKPLVSGIQKKRIGKVGN